MCTLRPYGAQRSICTMRAQPCLVGGIRLLSALLLATCIYPVSASVVVQYLESSAGYPTAGGVTVTVVGSGFGSASAALTVNIGSTACSQAAIKVTNSRITCKLGKLVAIPNDLCSQFAHIRGIRISDFRFQVLLHQAQPLDSSFLSLRERAQAPPAHSNTVRHCVHLGCIIFKLAFRSAVCVLCFIGQAH